MLQHTSIAKWPEIYATLFSETSMGFSIRKFINRVEQISYNMKMDEDEKKVFKGDMLEVLAEIFFDSFPNDPHFGIRNYQPVFKGEDYGVDGTGINANDAVVVMQSKYRNNPLDLVTYTELSKTFCSGSIEYGLNKNLDSNIFLFTTADDANHICKEVFQNRLVIINRSKIAHMIDNNIAFWTGAFDMIKEHIESKSGRSINSYISAV